MADTFSGSTWADRWSSNRTRFRQAFCHINDLTVYDEPQMLFGGVKRSDIGRFGGIAGVAKFTDLCWINVRTTPRHSLS
jgi:acyl-CoA reductase-like NAD-dependent aldehyde dehydrogenase